MPDLKGVPVPAAQPVGVAPAQVTANPAPAAPIPAHAGPPASAPASDQLRPAFAAAASPDGPGRLVVRLDPAELGQVQVGITRQPDGPARVELMAERPETLQLLMRDQPALHRALDQAGVPADGRTLHFQLGTPDAGRDAQAPAPQPGASGWGAGLGGGMGGGGQSSGQPGGRGPAPGWGGPPVPEVNPGAPALRPFRPAPGSRAGVDITA